MESLTIGKLAQAAGVNVETIRYYERRGLIVQPPRSSSGYRQYSSDHLWRLSFIGRAKCLGFTLAEIAEIVDASSNRSAEAIVAAARTKIDAVEGRQRELAQLRCRLEQLVDVCETGDSKDCLALDVTR